MNAISEVKTVALEDLDSTDLDGFNIINAVPEDGPVAEGDNVDRTLRLWADRNELYMMRLGDNAECESFRVLNVAVPDIADEEAIDRLKQAVSARID